MSEYESVSRICVQENFHSIFDISKEHQFYYIDNSNIYGKLLYKDGLHLLHVGNKLLAKKIVVSINKVLGKHTHHPKMCLNRMTVVRVRAQSYLM